MGGVGTGWHTFVGWVVQLGHLKVAGDRKSPKHTKKIWLKLPYFSSNKKKIVKGKNNLEFMFMM